VKARAPSYGPYLPRLVRDWSRGGSADARQLEGTLVSVDLSGFTQLSERLQAKGRAGAEELVLAVSGVFQSLIRITERHDGDVLKFRGDALLLFFHGDGHERRACCAAADMRGLIEATGETRSSMGPVTLRISTGVHTGICHFFLVGSTHRELVIAGPAATATIELESRAGAGEILLSERTAAALEPGWVGQPLSHGWLLLDIADKDLGALERVTGPGLSNGLEQYVPESLRAHLLLEAGEAEHRQVTAAFLKFTGVDESIAAEGAEAVHAGLSSLAEIVGDETKGFGLTWLESDIDVDGGKLYLVGGAPSSSGADEERMLRVLQIVLATYEGLILRAGVNRGPAFCGDIGADTRRTYAVMGDTVNLAARLASRAEPGGLLATAGVLERAHSRFEVSPQLFLFKGKEHPVTTYRVGAVLGEKEDEPHAELPFVGREGELAAIAVAVAGARVRRQQLVELIGEPGIGKSRLVEELRKQTPGFMQLVGRCDPYSSASAYSVFPGMLRPLVGLTPEMEPRDAGVHLLQWISEVIPDLSAFAPLVAVPFDAEVPPTRETEQLDPQFRRERLNECVGILLTRVLITPTLLVFEDAHWMDDASRDLVLSLTRAEASRPCLFCVTRRPQGGSFADLDVDGHVQLVLGPIDARAAQSLALAAAGEVAFSDEVLAAVVDRAGGNPLFVRELVAASRGARDVRLLPDSVETLIVTRMDTLAPEDRFLLRAASVLGTRFELDLLAEITEDELPDAGDPARWERLAEFVVWEGAGRLHFVHDLFRVAAYEGLSFRRRAQIHGRIGAVLEERAREATADLAELLSLHYHRAAEHKGAWKYSVLAGRRAQDRSANVEALELYERALDVAEHAGARPSEIAEIAEALGDVAELATRYETAEAAYERARTIVPNDMIAQSHLLRKQAVLCERRGRYSDALRWLGRALDALDDAEDSPQRVRSRADVELGYAGVKVRQGKFDEAQSWAERSAVSAEAGADRSRLGHAYSVSLLVAVRSGRRAPEHRDEALAILEEVGDLGRLLGLQNNIGIEAYYDGRWDDALDWYRRSGESASRVGDVVSAARAQNNEAEILSDRGRLEEARVLFEQALRVWRAADYRLGVALATSNLGRVMARSGQFDDAHRLLEEALAQFEKLGAKDFVGETEGRLAECLVLEGRHRETSEILARLLEEGSQQLAIAERLAGYAVVQSRAGFEEARPHFERSLEAAEAAGAEYEVALTLRAIAETSGVDDGRATEILGGLGVVSTPSVPLP
jgi:class 3 adenylate cyclase/tetratricopeptide (TPR) repeat protein